MCLYTVAAPLYAGPQSVCLYTVITAGPQSVVVFCVQCSFVDCDNPFVCWSTYSTFIVVAPLYVGPQSVCLYSVLTCLLVHCMFIMVDSVFFYFQVPVAYLGLCLSGVLLCSWWSQVLTFVATRLVVCS